MRLDERRQQTGRERDNHETLQDTNIQNADSGLILTVQPHVLGYTYTANTHIQSMQVHGSLVCRMLEHHAGEEEALPSTRRKRMEEYRKKRE